jgi:hypothetical protein
MEFPGESVMSDQSLEEFGKLLMERVRDEAIEQWDSMIAGQLKGQTAQKVSSLIAEQGIEKRDLLRALIPAIVDTTLHHLLWTIEQEQAISVSIGGGGELRDLSDGLPGDLVGWRERYSKCRRFC